MDFSANDFNICRFIRENQPQSKSELHKNFPDCEARLKKLSAEKYIDYYFDGEKFHADKFVLRDKGLLALQDYESQATADRKKLWEDRFWKVVSGVALLRAFAPELKEILTAIAQTLAR